MFFCRFLSRFRLNRSTQERRALVEKKQNEDRHRKQMRRAQMEARIQRNMAQAVKMEEKRKEHFWEKKAHHEVRVRVSYLFILRVCGGFTSFKRVVSRNDGSGWSLFRFRGHSMLRAGRRRA